MQQEHIGYGAGDGNDIERAITEAMRDLDMDGGGPRVSSRGEGEEVRRQ